MNHSKHIGALAVLALFLVADVSADGLYGCPEAGALLVLQDQPCSETSQGRADGTPAGTRKSSAALRGANEALPAALNIATELSARIVRAGHTREAEVYALEMAFDACVAGKARVINRLNRHGAPVQVLLRGPQMTLDRIPTPDGSVQVSCSRPDRSLLITRLAGG